MEGFKVLLAMCFLMSTESVQGISNSGNEFNLMFPPNLAAASAEFPPILYVTTDEDGPVQFTVSYTKFNPSLSGTSPHTARKKNLTRIELPYQLVASFSGVSPNKGQVNLKAEEGKNIIVYALNEGGASTDVYLGLPYFKTKTEKYCYYGISVPRSSLEPTTTYGYMAMVVQEAGTVITLTPTVQIEGLLLGAGLRFQPGRSYSSNPLAKGSTVLLSATQDLTGSKICSNKPITFITGHQCGFLPSNVTACDHLAEQLPPCETFGFKFVLVPLLLREQDGYRIVASRDGTTVNLNCVDMSGSCVQEDSFSLNEGQFRQLFIHSDRFCMLEANLPIVVVQIALGHSFDGVIPADPFMVMIPPLGQYRNDHSLIFAESFSINSRSSPVVFKPYLSLSVPSECCNRGQIEFDDGTIPWNIFVDVKDRYGEICACAAQYEVPSAQSRGGHCLQHSISECTVGVIVYAYEKENSYGYPGDMNIDSIAVPNYCFKDEEAIGSEPSGVLRFTLENTGTPEEACITFTTSDGTANAGTDFVVENNTCCFKAGHREAVCEIKINQDSLAEGEENFTVIIVPEDGQCVCNKSLTCKIIDDPVVVVEFNQTRYSVCEDAGFATLTVVSDIPAPVEFSGQVSFTDGTATASEDYISTPKEATFAKGASSATIQVPIIDDNQFERDEVFQAAISVPGNITGAKVTKGAKDEAQVTIRDKGNKIKFEKEAYTAEESVGNFTEVRLVADQPFAEDTSVPISFEDISANGCPNISVPDIDYGNSTVVVTFKAGEKFSSNASIPIISDDDDEGDEQFNATFELPGGYRNIEKGEPEEAVITIKDVVTVEPPVFAFEEGSYEVNEAAGTVRIGVVKQSGDIISGESVTIDVTPRQGSGQIGGAGPATEGVDYNSTTRQVVFQSSDSIQYVEIPITDDGVFERTEYFYADLAISAGSGSVGDPNTTTVNITEVGNTIRFENGNYRTNESVGDFTGVRLVADQPFAEDTSVSISFEDINATGGPDITASGVDYGNSVAVVTFPAGSRFSSYVSIPIANDSVANETDEQFRATFELPGGYRNLNNGEPEEAVITIENVVTEICVEFNETRYDVSEGDGFALLTLVSSTPIDTEYTVEVLTQDGDAEAGDDYLNGVAPFSATFAPGETSATVLIPIRNDSVLERLESFFGGLSIPGPAASLGVKAGARDNATVYIDDNDSVEVVFDPISYIVSESDGEVTLTLRANSTASFDYTLQVDTSDGSATGGDDYTSGGYEVTFPAGSSTAQITIDITDDNIAELTERFTARLSVSQSVSDRGVSVGSDDTATVNIEDNDVVTVEFTPFEYTVSESDGDVDLILVADKEASFDYTVEVTTADSTADSTASAGSDYTGVVRGTATFRAGETTATVRVPILEDDDLEGLETFIANLSIPDSSGSLGVRAGPRDSATVTIEDNDGVVVEFDPISYNVSEGDGEVTLTLRASSTASFDYTVRVDTSDGSATGGDDYTSGGYEVIFPAGSSTAQLTIDITDDNIPEPTENFTVRLSVSQSVSDLGVSVGSDNTATVNIEDNDVEPPVFAFEDGSYEVNEAAGIVRIGVVKQSGNIVSGRSVTLNVTPRQGSEPIRGEVPATEGDDYTSTTRQVVFQSSDSIQYVEIPITDDGVFEGTEYFYADLAISAGSGSVGAPNTTIVFITEAGPAGPVNVNFAPTIYNVSEEDECAKLTLMSDSPVSMNYTVKVITQDRRAMSGSDYEGGEYDAVFVAGETTATVCIPIIDDNDFGEGTENFVAFINATESSDDKRVQIGEDDEATVNIRDNDEIFIDFDPVTYNFSEGAGFASLTVKASAPSSTPYTVMVDTQDGSAVDTGDYAAGPYPVEFPSGVTEVQIMIPLLDDNTDECDENFFGNLRIPMQAANMGVKLGSADRATVTIKDDDKFQVNFVSTEMEVFEEQTRVRVCLEHNRACMEEFTVQVGNRPHSNRSASSPDDYRNGPYEVFFPEGEKMACIDIPVIDDGVEEGPERFQLQIMPPDNGGVPFEPGSKPMAQITIRDGNIDGDPMFTVPLSINKKMLSQFSKEDKQWDLCYEVHGREDKIYNLVSDQCVFVNTHLKLASNPKVGNIMARIGIVAKDYDGRCHKIQADLEGKKVTINDMQMKNRNWVGRGISVIKLGDKVRVSVPNCKGQKMVFWIVFHFMNGADMIKFIIADGTGLSPSSHGLMGQFWNTPVEIKAMKSEQADTGRSYRVIIYSPFTGPRQFTGDYYPITWDYGKTPCLYAGTKDGSPVIEGKFTEYEVKELFDPHFSYSQFKRKQCSE